MNKDPQKILILGDTHGDIAFIEKIYQLIEEEGDIDCVIQLGDFGYWPRIEQGQLFINKVQDCPIPFYFLDGNHEDFKSLDIRNKSTATVHHIGGSLYYLPRGYCWTWNDIKLMSMGGAFSIDRQHRTLGESWFYDELITYEQIEAALTHSSIDILFSHDCPNFVSLKEILGRNAEEMWYSQSNRDYLADLCKKLKPTYIFHGHYHSYHEHLYQYSGYNVSQSITKVIGLHCNKALYLSYCIMDLNEIAEQLNTFKED